jgi:predicted nucleic acid-binding protein
MIVLADSGILLRLVHRTDPFHQDVRTAVRTLKQRGDELVTSPQNLAEFWNVCTRPVTARGGFGYSLADTEKKLRVVERIVGLLPETPSGYSIWKKLVVQHGVKGVQVHDARVVALLTAHGLTHLLTLNPADFLRYQGITVLTPGGIMTGRE